MIVFKARLHVSLGLNISVLKSVLFVLGVCACVGVCTVTTSIQKVGRQ